MKRLIEAIMKRTGIVMISLLLILVWGGVAAYQMQRDYLPPINNPTLMVTLHAPNMQAEQIKAIVTDPVEQAVRTINGLQSLETNSYNNGLLISLYFPMDYDMDRAENEVNSVLKDVSLPASVGKPAVARVSTSSFPIMRLSLTSPSGGVDDHKLRTEVQTQIARELQTLPGVSDVRVTGAGRDGYVITVRQEDMRRNELTMADIKQALLASEAGGVQGSITNSQVTIPLQVSVGSTGGVELKQLPVTGSKGQIVPLQAVADVSPSLVDLQTISRTDGKASVVIDVMKTQAANITDVSQRIHERIQDMPSLQTGDIKLSVLFDQGEQVKASLYALLKEGLLGCLLSMVCVFFFFRNVRSTMLIALSLPICFLVTTGLLHAMGISLNILTVSGLIVAMGRVIDDSIVILDNIYRKAEEQRGRLNAGGIAKAVKEMLPAIAASTAATVAVYIPISFAGGMISSAFSGFAWSVVIALVTSLLVAMFVVPALYHVWQKNQKNDSAVSVEPFWRKVLHWSFPRRGIILTIFVLLFIAAGIGGSLLPVNFLPANKTGQINVQLEFPAGTSLPQVDATAARMEQALQTNADIASFSSVLGSTFTPQFDDVFDAGGGWIQSNTTANIAVQVKPKANVDAVAAMLQQKLGGLSGRAVCTVTNQNIAGDDSQLKIYLTGSDAVTLDQTAKQIRSRLQAVSGISVTGAVDDAEGIPSHQLVLNPDAMKRAGIEADAVYDRIGTYLSEGSRMDLNAGSSAVPLVIRTDALQNAGKSTAILTDPATDILTMLGEEVFQDKNGKPVRLKELASLTPASGQSVIREREGRPFSVVAVNLTTRDVEKAAGRVHQLVGQLALPSGVHYSFNGITTQVNQMIAQMGIAIAVSVFLILLILSMVFRSLRAPLTVLLCIPLAFIGSIFGMLATGGEWNLASLVGLLMLSGIVVTNGIVLVDKIERNLAGGMEKAAAIVDGTVSRVRPVFMTAAATVLTLLPLCLSARGDTVVSQSLGIVVVCGMISSTIISLLVIPILYIRMTERRPVRASEQKKEMVAV